MFSTMLYGMGNNKPDINWVKSFVMDSLKTDSLKGDFLFFQTGQGIIRWSLITRDSAGYNFYNGATNLSTKQKYDKDQDLAPIADTTLFINNNYKTLKWAFDSLKNDVSLMKLCPPDEKYLPFFSTFDVFEDGKCIFHHDVYHSKYSGPDIENFNKNLSKTWYLMFWLAGANMRDKLAGEPADNLLQKNKIKKKKRKR